MSERRPYIERPERAALTWIVDPRGAITPGFFKARLVKGGPFVPVRTWVDEDRDPETKELMADQVWHAEVDGKELNPIPRGYTLMGVAIEESEYRFMRDAAAWDRKHDPAAPAANPRQPVSLRQLKPIEP